MQAETQVPPIPKSKKDENKVLRQCEVNVDLWDAVAKERDRLGLTTRQVMQWGLESFLATTNPKEAARLGIKTRKP